MPDEPASKKMKRTRPHKKWKSTEIQLLLDYLHDAEEFEAPTAQIFYKQFIDLSGIDATWDILKCKVRHLRIKYNKACAYLTAAESDGSEGSQGQLYKICPYFDRCEQVFTRSGVTEPSLRSTRSSAAEQVPKCDKSSVRKTAAQNARRSVTGPDSKYAEKIQSAASRKHVTSISDLLDFQKERTYVYKMRLEFEREKWTAQNKLEEKRLIFEEKKFHEECKLRQRELDLKELALQQQDQIKKMEIEKNEKVALYELELKYEQNT